MLVTKTNYLDQLTHLREEINIVDDEIIKTLVEMQRRIKKRSAGSKSDNGIVQYILEKITGAGNGLRDEFIFEVIETVVKNLSVEINCISFFDISPEVRKLLELIKERMEFSIAVGEIKKDQGLSVFNKERENFVKSRWMLEAAKKSLDTFFFHDIIEVILRESRLLQLEIKEK